MTMHLLHRLGAMIGMLTGFPKSSHPFQKYNVAPRLGLRAVERRLRRRLPHQARWLSAAETNHP